MNCMDTQDFWLNLILGHCRINKWHDRLNYWQRKLCQPSTNIVNKIEKSVESGSDSLRFFKSKRLTISSSSTVQTKIKGILY